MTDDLLQFTINLLDIDPSEDTLSVKDGDMMKSYLFDRNGTFSERRNFRSVAMIKSRYRAFMAARGVEPRKDFDVFVSQGARPQDINLTLFSKSANYSVRVTPQDGNISVEEYHGGVNSNHLRWISKLEDDESRKVSHSYINILKQVFAQYANFGISMDGALQNHFMTTPEGVQQVLEHVSQPASAEDCLFAARNLMGSDACDIRWRMANDSVVSILISDSAQEMLIDYSAVDGGHFIDNKLNLNGSKHTAKILKFIMDRFQHTGQRSGSLKHDGSLSNSVEYWDSGDVFIRTEVVSGALLSKLNPVLNIGYHDKLQADLSEAVSRFMIKTGLDKTNYKINFDNLEDRNLQGSPVTQLHCEIEIKDLGSIDDIDLSFKSGNFAYIGWNEKPNLSYSIAMMDSDLRILIDGLLLPDNIVGRKGVSDTLILNAVVVNHEFSTEEIIKQVVKETTDRVFQFASEKYHYLIDNNRARYHKAVKKMSLLMPQYVMGCYGMASSIIYKEPFVDVLITKANEIDVSDPVQSVRWIRSDDIMHINIQHLEVSDTYAYCLKSGALSASNGNNDSNRIPEPIWSLIRHIAVYSNQSGILSGKILPNDHVDWRKDITAIRRDDSAIYKRFINPEILERFGRHIDT